MRLLRALYRNSMAGLVGLVVVVLTWGVPGACATYYLEVMAGTSLCSCSQAAHNGCEEREASACTCACSINNPAIPSSVSNILSLQTRTVALAALSWVSSVSGPVSPSALRISPPINPIPPPDLLRSVILLI